MCLVKLARRAMATLFELALYGEDEAYLLAAGEAALDEIDRLEAQLSFYRSDSDISDLNARAAAEWVTVEPRLFRLLERAAQLSEESDGAFDITVAPLLRCWGFVGGTGQMPTPDAIEAARELVGMRHVLLDAANHTVHYDRPGIQIDLGAIGKGYALDQAVGLLREFGIQSALLHGGTSSVYTLGAPPDADAWQIAVQRPLATEEGSYLAQVALKDRALSVSAPHGKWFEANGRRYGHVLDPRTGYPATRNLLAAIVTDSATEGDALSTALLTRGEDWLPELLYRHPDFQALIAIETEPGAWRIARHGFVIE